MQRENQQLILKALKKTKKVVEDKKSVSLASSDYKSIKGDED
jgi:hypothetical protein